jgi:hypothetical protein
MGAVDQEAFAGVPNAVLDTNVGLAIYSWHDLVAIAAEHPSATLEHTAIQFRAQRARTAFFLTLFLHQNEWKTLVPLSEWRRKLIETSPPNGPEHSVESSFFFLYVRPKLLPGWYAGGDLNSDAAIRGTNVDRLCLDWAEQHKTPLVSWEGHGPNGLDRSKLIPREAPRRGIDLLTPEELLRRQNFDASAAVQRFFSDWDSQVGGYLSVRPDAKAMLEGMRDFYQRLSDNDWT